MLLLMFHKAHYSHKYLVSKLMTIAPENQKRVDQVPRSAQRFEYLNQIF